MKKSKYLLASLFIVLSFYFTDQIIMYIDNKNPIMQEIIRVEDDYNTKPVNATINDNTIIPGINGKIINKHKSLVKMNEFGKFNDIYLIYDEITPDISINNYPNKIIIKGNNKKRNISLIIEENKIIEEYLNNLNTKYDIISNLNTSLTNNREYINGESDNKNFSDLDSILKKNKLNSKICLINYSNYDSCLNKKYHIVSHSLNANLFSIINNKLDNGEIVLITKTTSLDTLKLLVNECKRQDLSIVYLSELIKE